MIVTKQHALHAIEEGEAHFTGITRDEQTDRDHWILTNTRYARTDHCPIEDGETMVGCSDCGLIVEPEPDKTGIGCHCPNCTATL